MRKLCCVVLFSIIQVISINPDVQAQVKLGDAPLVVIAKASGEIFLEKGRNKREYKPKFTEVDISNYASGVIYAELKMSSGDCDPVLTTTATPTEDRRNNVIYISIRPGKAPGSVLSIRDGLISHFDRNLASKFNKSPKLYVSANFRFQGMMLWYAKECSGTYEITVYVWKGIKICGTLPPIPSELGRKIAELNRLTTYGERSTAYNQIHKELHKRGIGVGFFEAASTVTNNFYYDLWKFDKKAQGFLNGLSKELAGINARYATELLQTGKLEKEDKSGYFSEPTAIDIELVRREQAFAEKKLSNLSEGREIITLINDRTNSALNKFIGEALFSSVSATNKVRDNKRKTNPNADFDYGNIKDRTSVGEILAGKYRDNFLPNAILCR